MAIFEQSIYKNIKIYLKKLKKCYFKKHTKQKKILQNKLYKNYI